jgi:hypothetical protein
MGGKVCTICNRRFLASNILLDYKCDECARDLTKKVPCRYCMLLEHPKYTCVEWWFIINGEYITSCFRCHYVFVQGEACQQFACPSCTISICKMCGDLYDNCACKATNGYNVKCEKHNMYFKKDSYCK